MKTVFYTLLILFQFQFLFAQFTSGNVFVNTSCDYQINGSYYNSSTQTAINFAYDSALMAYKIVVPITTDSINVCVYPVACNCNPECQTFYGTSNILINFNICISTGLKELSSNNLIYPNPFSEKIQIEFSGNNHLTIYDNLGFLIHKEEFMNKITVNTQNLQPGHYILVISDGLLTKRYKMIKLK